MKNIIKEVNAMKNTPIRKTIERRLSEFEALGRRGEKEWFSELCFCLLTANSKARTAISIQKELGQEGFLCALQKDVRDCIRRNKHRFHNNKAAYICDARKHIGIKRRITKMVKEEGEISARRWLADNVKGLGFKEASHFMRNVGYKNLSILDRHILNLMAEDNIIKEKPRSITRKNYLDIEKKFLSIARSLGMSAAELDLYMWYMKTGEVLK